MQFSRGTIVALIDAWEKELTVEGFNRILLKYGLEDTAPFSSGTKPKRLNMLAQHLVANPDESGLSGSPLILELIEEEIDRCWEESAFGDPIDNFSPALINSLKRDGYIVQDGELRTTLPQSMQLAQKEDELHLLLDKNGFSVAKGHLDQAVAAHTRGDWASANGQLRTYVESLFDSIARAIEPVAAAQESSSHQRRELLARLDPPFFDDSLNEWVIGGSGGFVQGFWRRLNPQGSHPGLSDEEDSTFRLHLVVLTTHHFLVRLDKRNAP
jgi:hypothetical protein